jgi:hypothetical protein
MPLVEFSQRNVVDRLWRRCDDSFVWIFYGPQRPAGGFEEVRLRVRFPPPTDSCSSRSRASPRLVAARLPTWRVDHTGWSVLISPEHGARVASFWCSFESEAGPRSLDEALAVKRCELVGGDGAAGRVQAQDARVRARVPLRCDQGCAAVDGAERAGGGA